MGKFSKAEYADYGSDPAIMGSNFNCLFQSSTRDFPYETLNSSLPIKAPRCQFPSGVTFTSDVTSHENVNCFVIMLFFYNQI